MGTIFYDRLKREVKMLTVFMAVHLLSEGTEWVAEGFGCQVEQSLQEHVDLQRVEALALIWRKRKECKALLLQSAQKKNMKST